MPVWGHFDTAEMEASLASRGFACKSTCGFEDEAPWQEKPQ